MDFQQFGIDERLLSGVPSLRNQALFHEKMLTHAVKQGENVYARLSVSSGREAIYLLPALQWLASGATSGARTGETRVLCLVPDLEAARKSAAAALSIGSGIGLEACVVSLEGEGTQAGQPAQAVVAPIIEGNPRATFVAGSLEALLAAQDLIGLHDFGFLLVDGAERIAELPSERIRHFSSALRPSWERRGIVVCGRNSAKAKNLAWDLTENPVEFHIEEEAAKAQSVSQESWHIASDRKLCFLLGLLARRRPSRTCVFCNLKSGAEELALRLRYNGVEADYILGSLPPDRKAAILSDLAAEEGSVLVLTDEGAAGLKGGSFPLVVNYDIPLDPELYVKRLEMLDRSGASSGIVNLACDRYVYGLPAVEQYIDASLDAKPVDESLLRAEDKSADLAFERPRFDREATRGAPRVGRLVAAGTARSAEGEARRPPEGGRTRDHEAGSGGSGNSGGSGSARPRPGDGGQGHRRHSGREDEARQSRPDRSPDIRRKIAEATGGSIDMEGRPAQAERHEGREAGKAGNAGAGKAAGRQGPGKQGSRQGQRGGSAPRGGRQGQGRQAPRQQAPRSEAKREPTEADPYALSMEERMQRYREKYGQAGDGKDQGQRPSPRQASRGQGPSPQGRKPAPAGGQDRPAPKAGGTRAGSPGRAPDAQSKGRPAESEARKAAEPDSSGRSGLFSKLFGSRKKK